jgi:hypothetical protein
VGPAARCCPGGGAGDGAGLGRLISVSRGLAWGLWPIANDDQAAVRRWSDTRLGSGERLVLSVDSTALTTSDLGGCTRCCTNGGIPIAMPWQPVDQGSLEDPDLQDLIQAWGNLPQAVRVGVVAMVRASVECRGSG